MIIEHLERDNFTLWYDTDERVLHVRYRGTLSPETTRAFYTELGGVIQRNPLEVGRALGSIYDFRDVSQFESRNLTAAQRQSQDLNSRFELANHPVAVLVGTRLQESILRVELSISPQQNRKRVVWSEAEGLAFINAFHAGSRAAESE